MKPSISIAYIVQIRSAVMDDWESVAFVDSKEDAEAVRSKRKKWGMDYNVRIMKRTTIQEWELIV